VIALGQVNKIYGDDGDNVLVGRGRNDQAFGFDGADLIQGHGGLDSLNGGAGADTLQGGGGDDWLVSYNPKEQGGENEPGDSLAGEGGDDRLSAGSGDTALGGVGDDSVFAVTGAGGLFDGGSGRDVLELHLGEAFVGDFSGLAHGGEMAVQGATVRGFEGGLIVLGIGDDHAALGFRGDFSLQGGAGDDELSGSAGSDTLSGGLGSDTVHAGAGDDLVFDPVTSPGAGDVDQVFGGKGDDTLFATDGDDILSGGSGDDHLLFEASHDFGDQGRDLLRGGGGDDFLQVRYAAAATLQGGAGTDTLFAGRAADTLQGGAGEDVYRFQLVLYRHGADNIHLIQDRSIGVVDLSPVAVGHSAGSRLHIVDHFDGVAGELTIAYSPTDDLTRVEGDVDGDKVADLVLVITGDYTDPNGYVL